MIEPTAKATWTRLAPKHSVVLRRAERASALTLRHLLQTDDSDKDLQDAPNVGSNFGAQIVNALTSKLVQALFSPTTPVGRLTAGAKGRAALAAQLGDTELDNALAAAEVKARDAVAATGARARLFSAIAHCIVCGNYLLDLDLKARKARGFSLQHYRLRLTLDQRIHTLVIHERVIGGELPAAAREATGIALDDIKERGYYTWVRLLESGRYEETHWVDDTKIDSIEYSAEDQHFFPLHWTLPDDRDYGVGLVEQYMFDLETHTLLSKALAEGATLSCEFRWLVANSGVATIDAIKESTNGQAVAGRKEDVSGVSLGDANRVSPLVGIIQVWEARLSRGFLYVASQIRQAERVTAEEIRLLVDELEQAYGGAYTTLADNTVKPLLLWGLRLAGLWDPRAKLDLSVVSGAESLSRGADLQRLQQGIGMLNAAVAGPLGDRLDIQKLATRTGTLLSTNLAEFIVDKTAVQSSAAQDAAIQTSTDAARQQGA